MNNLLGCEQLIEFYFNSPTGEVSVSNAFEISEQSVIDRKHFRH